MAAPGSSNLLARRVIDDLIDFSGETSVAKSMKDDVWDENTKLMGLNDAIVKAEEKIAMKEEHVKTMVASLVMAAFLLLDKLAEVAGSSHLQDRINFVFSRVCSEAELEALGQQGDALRSFDYLREMVVRDSRTLGVLEQLSMGAHVGMRLEGWLCSKIPNFVCIAVDTSRETRVRRKDTIGALVIVFILPYLPFRCISDISELQLQEHWYMLVLVNSGDASAGWPAAVSRGGETGGRASRGGGRTRGRSGNQGDGRIDHQGSQDGKVSVIMYTRWVEKIESVQDMSGCRDSQKEDFKSLTREEFFSSNKMQKLETKLWNHTMVRAGHAAYTDRFHELPRFVPHLVILKGKRIERYVYGLALQIRGMVAAMDPKTIQKAMQIAGTLTDEALRNGSIKKNPEKRGNRGEPSKNRNVRDENKRTRTGNAFVTTTNPVRRENTGTVPKCTTCNTHHLSGVPCRTCFNCNHLVHFAKDCRVVPRNVNPINARNLTVKAYYECGSTDHVKSACLRLNLYQRLGEAIKTKSWPSMRISFISTTFIPLLGIEPSDLGFSYEIQIASGQLVEIDKVIKGCKLEIEGHVFDINLIPFESRSFDVIIGMDWLSNHKAEIICHKKVVRIPLLDGKVFRVLGEKPKEKIRQLMCAKAKEKKQEDIVVVKDFPKVFLDDLSGLLLV
nr:hypothetical protein [Tanacetum cinerariifolium]